MTEPTIAQPVSIAEDDFDFDDWLSTGTVTRRSVELHNRGDLIAQHDELERRLAVAEAAAKAAAGEKSLGAPTGESVDAVIAEMEALHEAWQAAGIVVVVRGLDEDEIKEIHAAVPIPDLPEILTGEKPDPGTPEAEARNAATKDWLAERDRVVEEQNIRSIAAAVVEIRKGDKIARRMSVAQVRALRARPHGKNNTTKLINAVASATTGEVEVPRPTPRPVSGTGRG